MDVQDPVPVVPHKIGRENPHESGEDHQLHPGGVEALHQPPVVLLALLTGRVQEKAGHAELAGDPQSSRLRLVGQDYLHLRREISGQLRQ